MKFWYSGVLSGHDETIIYREKKDIQILKVMLT